jgi:hypothetical protein
MSDDEVEIDDPTSVVGMPETDGHFTNPAPGKVAARNGEQDRYVNRNPDHSTPISESR